MPLIDIGNLLERVSMKRRLFFSFIILLSCIMLLGCSSPKNFTGKWKTDIFDQGTVREDGAKIAGKATGQTDLASIISKYIHWNATMEIKKDGTLTMDNGETFSAKWHQKGDKIVIEGKNISGIATLSDDQKTLYFENKPLNDNSDNQNGFMIGENSLKFEFKKVE